MTDHKKNLNSEIEIEILAMIEILLQSHLQERKIKQNVLWIEDCQLYNEIIRIAKLNLSQFLFLTANLHLQCKKCITKHVLCTIF